MGLNEIARLPGTTIAIDCECPFGHSIIAGDTKMLDFSCERRDLAQPEPCLAFTTQSISLRRPEPGHDACVRRSARRRRGATTIEMAFVAPFVILLVFSSIEFSRMMMIKQSLTNTARECCRHASLATTRTHQESSDHARDRMRGAIKDYQDPEVLRIEITPEFSSVPATGTLITASIEVDCEDVSWLPPMFFAGARIRASTSINHE